MAPATPSCGRAGDSLRDNPDLDPALDGPAQVSGLQGNSRALVRPRNDPPMRSMFTDFDGNTDDDQATAHGHVGKVAIWQTCEGTPEFTLDDEEGDDSFYLPPPGYAPPDDFNLTLEKWSKPYSCFDGGAELVVQLHHPGREHRRPCPIGDRWWSTTICLPAIPARR